MKKIYQCNGDGKACNLDCIPTEVTNMEGRCWANLTNPTPEELRSVATDFSVPLRFLESALDDEAVSTFEFDENDAENMLILIDVPLTEELTRAKRTSLLYQTYPLAIIHSAKGIITVCLKENPAVRKFTDGTVGYSTGKRSRFILQLLRQISLTYISYLTELNKKSGEIEEKLYDSMNNDELIKLLALSKSLIYFNTSLATNANVLDELVKQPTINKHPEDAPVLTAVIIGNKQALEMVRIYTEILNNTIDVFASIIANNQNRAMKFLAALAIVAAVPTVIGGLFGMNVGGIPANTHPFGFWIIVGVSIAIAIPLTMFLWKKKIF